MANITGTVLNRNGDANFTQTLHKFKNYSINIFNQPNNNKNPFLLKILNVILTFFDIKNKNSHKRLDKKKFEHFDFRDFINHHKA